ncbi:hypothetical protein HPHPA4_0234 [Helicobacter pylori Hp A-4]|nr:hypothetical protein HPHPA4_0234 [Helicobacter pylori Hp A-4]
MIVPHNALLWGYGGFSFGFEEGVKVQNTPYFLMSLNKLNEFYYKMKSKTIK